MPLSEFYRMARGNLESARQRTAINSTDPSYIPESECLELVWENGPVVMQGQANKVRRTPSFTNLETQYQKDLGNSTNSNMGSALTNLATDAPRVEMGLGQDDDDDDMVPWMNYPMEDYCSGLLPEISGLTVAAQSSPSSMDKRTGLRNTSIPTSLSLEKANTPKQELGQSSRPRSGQVYPWTFQEIQELAPSPNSRMPGNSITIQSSPSGSTVAKTQKQDSALVNSSSNFMNFSHFSRPVALAQVNLHKGTVPSGANVAEPTPLNSKTGLVKEVRAADLAKRLKTSVARPIEESRTTNQSANVCRDDSVKTNKMAKEILGESAIPGMPANNEKKSELVVASSSASGSSLERASNEPKHNLKRKCRETDDSEGRSEDIEESLGIRKAAHLRGVGSKRGRAADVHNLSERRRRDRINEKMRALQELIPNCNKVDKASMLDEAIEYLKTLQLQVQIMSMGSGMYMPSMMVPAGMQHMHPAHMAQFSPMAVGMGMNMGFGMSMMDMGGASHPLMQMPRVSGSQFAASRPSSISGPIGFHGMAGTNLQGFGHPSPGFPISAPHTLSLPSSSQMPPVSSSRGVIDNGMHVAVQAPIPAPSLDPKNFLQMINAQVTDVADGSRSINPKSNEPSSDVLEQST